MLTAAGDLSVLLHGAGGLSAPVIALHDLGAGPRVWDLVASRLASAGHPVAAVSLSSPAVSSLPDLAAAVASVASALDWWPIVVGHRWGAALALEVASSFPSLTRAQVWIDGGTDRLADLFPDLPTAIAATGLGFVPTDPARAARLVGLQHPDWPSSAVEASLDGLGSLSVFDHANLMEAWWGQDPPALWPRVNVPVTLVPVTDDTVSSTRAAPVTRSSVPTAAAALLRSTVHPVAGDSSVLLDQPDLVAGLIVAAEPLAG